MNKKTTLKLNRDFRRLYYKGSSAVHPLIVTYASKNRLGYNRIGIHRHQKNRKGSLSQSLQENHTGGVCSGEHPNRAGMGFCVCCADENAAGKIYRARTGPQKNKSRALQDRTSPRQMPIQQKQRDDHPKRICPKGRRLPNTGELQENNKGKTEDVL